MVLTIVTLSMLSKNIFVCILELSTLNGDETKKPNHKITLPKLKSNLILILDELILRISNILSNIIYYQHVLTNKGVR